MCNPRRIKVKATRTLAEAWTAEINRAATARDTVTAEARLVQAIGDLLPPAAKTAFEAALRVDARWAQVDGEYRRAVPGGHITYRPETGELEIRIRLSTAVEEVATHTLIASGEITDEVTAEADSYFYTDGFGGRTREVAFDEATQAAEAAADELAEKRAASLKQAAQDAAKHALSDRADEAEELARLKAEEKLTLRVGEVRPDLDRKAEERLTAVRDEVLTGIFELVARGYSAALQAYAAEHGENLSVTEEDGVIQIEFEVEA